MQRRQFLSAVLLLSLWFSSGCATRKPGDPLRPGYNVYTPEQDVQIGREAAAEIRQQVDIVDNRRLQDYVDSVGKLLASQPEAEDYPYEFTLINEDSINAFALPGGPIFVHSGLLEAADNEAEFAGVLAHEISHVALRHGTSQASKANMIQLPAVLAGAVIGQDSALAQVGQLGLGLGVNAVFMKYSREAEKESDALGARILAGAGYDPIAMATFFEKLEAQGGARGPQFLSSHPNPGNRVQNVRAEIQTFQTPRQYNARTGDFPRMKQQVAQLPPPNPPRQAVANAASPSAGPPAPPARGGFRQLQGRTFSVAYPGGWETFGNQQSAVLTIAPRQGLVRTPQGGVSLGYGAVLSYYRPRSPGANNLQGATRELIGQLQQVNPNLRVTGRSRRVQVQGSAGLVVNLSGRSPYGGAERDVLLAVARPEGLFYMVFVAPEQGFNQLEPTFEQMLGSIRFRN